MKEGDYRECPKGRDPSKCEIATCCAACDYYYESKKEKNRKNGKNGTQ